MKKSLYLQLLEYKKSDMSSFHTPGHKNNFYKSLDLLGLDYTELPLTDSLYEASGAIKNSEEMLSGLYGSKASFFSSGGNTLCIQAMIRMCAKKGEKILCDRLVHRSAVSAMALLGIEPVWVRRSFKGGIPWSIDIQDLKKKISENKDVKAFYVTSPNYYGVIQDIALISSVCKSFGVPVIVDNAHGAHLKFLGLHPLDFGASMTADSAHKTLPVLTIGAFLHVNEEKFIAKAKPAMALFGSTSPSYPVMASLDFARSWLSENGEREFEVLKQRVKTLKKFLPHKDLFLEDIDPVRIVINAKSIGLGGKELGEMLRKFKIEPEMCDENYVVLIPSPFNREKDWLRLEEFLKNIKPKERKKIENPEQMNIPKSVMPLFEAISSESEALSLEKSIGKVAAQIVCPCPPGVPVVMPGEKIGQQEVSSLLKYGISKIDVVK